MDEACTVQTIAAVRIPSPRPGMMLSKIHPAVLVPGFSRQTIPSPIVERSQPSQSPHLYRPVRVMMIPQTIALGATVNVCGKSATPVRMGSNSLTAE